MRAIYLLGKGSLETRDVPEPRVEGPNDALIETDALSICTTDVEIIQGRMPPKKLPIVIGHEASGRVVEATRAKSIKKGDRVLVDPNLSDSTCTMCRMGLSHLCVNGGLMGRETDGVFAERLVIPLRNLYKLPDSVPPEVSPLIQPLSTAVHAIKKVDVVPGSSVLILGLGVTGLMLMQLARHEGAHVIASSTVSKKLDLAQRLGADVVVNRSEVDLASKVAEVTRNGVDLAIIATSSADSLVKTCVQALRPGGTVLLFSIGAGSLGLDGFQAYFKEVTIKASRSSQPEDFKEAIRLVAGKKIDLAYQISRTFPFRKTAEAISFFQDRASVLKIVVRAT